MGLKEKITDLTIYLIVAGFTLYVINEAFIKSSKPKFYEKDGKVIGITTNSSKSKKIYVVDKDYDGEFDQCTYIYNPILGIHGSRVLSFNCKMKDLSQSHPLIRQNEQFLENRLQELQEEYSAWRENQRTLHLNK